MIKIGLTGGIGSGKSTATRIFSMLDVPIYDSDARAKQILAGDEDIICRVKNLLGEQSYSNNSPDRGYIASRVFSNPELLEKLNSIIHPAVKADYREWASQHSSYPYTIMESAILIESGFDADVDRIVVISAPENLRLERTIKRDNCTPEQARKRIDAQISDEERIMRADYILYNDETSLLIPQIIALDKELKNAR